MDDLLSLDEILNAPEKPSLTNKSIDDDNNVLSIDEILNAPEKTSMPDVTRPSKQVEVSDIPKPDVKDQVNPPAIDINNKKIQTRNTIDDLLGNNIRKLDDTEMDQIVDIINNDDNWLDGNFYPPSYPVMQKLYDILSNTERARSILAEYSFTRPIAPNVSSYISKTRSKGKEPSGWGLFWNGLSDLFQAPGRVVASVATASAESIKGTGDFVPVFTTEMSSSDEEVGEKSRMARSMMTWTPYSGWIAAKGAKYAGKYGKGIAEGVYQSLIDAGQTSVNEDDAAGLALLEIAIGGATGGLATKAFGNRRGFVEVFVDSKYASQASNFAKKIATEGGGKPTRNHGILKKYLEQGDDLSKRDLLRLVSEEKDKYPDLYEALHDPVNAIKKSISPINIKKTHTGALLDYHRSAEMKAGLKDFVKSKVGQNEIKQILVDLHKHMQGDASFTKLYKTFLQHGSKAKSGRKTKPFIEQLAQIRHDNRNSAAYIIRKMGEEAKTLHQADWQALKTIQSATDAELGTYLQILSKGVIPADLKGVKIAPNMEEALKNIKMKAPTLKDMILDVLWAIPKAIIRPKLGAVAANITSETYKKFKPGIPLRIQDAIDNGEITEEEWNNSSSAAKESFMRGVSGIGVIKATAKAKRKGYNPKR